jgi:eukaryotic-like serine/threonine-protein kinase
VLAVALLAVSALIVRSRFRQRAFPNPFVTGTEPERLTTSPGREGSPDLSRDGRLVAYSSNLGPSGSLELFILPLGAGDPIQLTHNAIDEWNPRFSPDGKEILFLRGASGAETATAWRMPAFGGSESLVATDVTAADWSPDGTEVGLARRLGDEWRLEKRRPGSEPGQLVASGTGSITALAWSPAGNRFAYVEQGAIWIVSATEGGSPRRLTETTRQIRSVVWESSHTLLTDASWTGGTSRISRLDADDGAAEVLLAGPPGIHELALAIDSGELVYVVEHKVRQVWRLGSDRSATALPLPTTVEGFDIDASGVRVAFTDWDPSPGRTSLRLLELSTGGERSLGEGLCPAISPNGRWVASLGDRAGEMGLRLIDLESGESRTLIADSRAPGRPDGALFRCPAFSPDGLRIAVAVGKAEKESLQIVERSGASSDLGAGLFGPPVFSPSGRRLAVCDFEPDPARLRLFDGMSEEIPDVPMLCPFRTAPAWSDDETVWLVEEQKRDPALVGHALDGREIGRRPLGVPRDPAFWGVFDLRRTPSGDLYALVERYEADLFRVGGARR